MKKKYVVGICLLTCGIFTSCITENNYSTGFGGTSEENPEFNETTTDSSSGSFSGYETGGSGGDDDNNSISSSNNTSSVASSTSSGCIPGTCEQIGAECGKIFDGCGNYISCGTCTVSFGEMPCGTERFENGVSVGVKPNLCGGGCVYKRTEDALINCHTEFEGNFDFYFSCTPYRQEMHDMYGGCETINDWSDTCCKNGP